MEFKKRNKNFRDIKQSIIQNKSALQMVPRTILQDLGIEIPETNEGKLSFKKLQTLRNNDNNNKTFISPPKMFTINTKPIENIDLSSTKKREHYQYKTQIYRKESEKENRENSARSNNSTKKQKFSQFSKLIQGSKEKEILKNKNSNISNRQPSTPTTSNTVLCFQKILRKTESDTKSNTSAPTPNKNIDDQAYYTKILAQKAKLVHQKICGGGQTYIKVPQIVITSPSSIPLQESLKSEFDQVNISRDHEENSLDMAPCF